MTINLVQPEVIVSLGAVVLKALSYISPHAIKLKEDVGCCIRWDGRVLIPLYHPGPRARIHRSMPKQISDFAALAKFVQPDVGIISK